MARLIKGSLCSLRSSHVLSSPTVRQHRFLKVSEEARQSVKRWYGGNAMLEDSSNCDQTTMESNGIPKTVKDEESPSNLMEGIREAFKHDSAPVAATLKSSEAEDKPSSERTAKLSEFILSRFRNRTATNVKSDSLVKNTGSLLSTPNISSDEGADKRRSWEHIINTGSSLSKPKILSDESADKKRSWEHVIESIREISAKKKQEMMSSKQKDDFADLDLPQAGTEAAEAKNSNDSNRHPVSLLMNAFGNPPNNKAASHGWTPSGEKKPFIPRSSLFDAHNAKRRVDMTEKGSTSREHGSHKTANSISQTSDDIEESDTMKENSFDQHNKGSRLGMLSGYVVCIQNLPPDSNFHLVRDAVARFGVVTGWSKRSTPNGLWCCYVAFQNEESMEDALTAQRVQLGGKSFPIVRTDWPTTTVVRISKVSPEMTENQILFACEKFGSVDSIRKRCTSVFDVYYKPSELANIPSIMNSLNEVIINHCRWTALPAPLLHPQEKKNFLGKRDGQAWQVSQMARVLKKIEWSIDNAYIAFEDLKVLNSIEEGTRPYYK